MNKHRFKSKFAHALIFCFVQSTLFSSCALADDGQIVVITGSGGGDGSGSTGVDG